MCLSASLRRSQLGVRCCRHSDETTLPQRQHYKHRTRCQTALQERSGQGRCLRTTSPLLPETQPVLRHPTSKGCPSLWAECGAQSLMIDSAWSCSKTALNLETSADWTHPWVSVFVQWHSLCDPWKCRHVTVYDPGTLPRTGQNNISSGCSVNPCPEGVATRLARSGDNLWHWHYLLTSHPSIQPQ